MLLKQIKAKREGLERGFTIDLRKLESYSTKQLQDFIRGYEKFIETFQNELLDELSTITEMNKELGEVNVGLNSKLIESEIKEDLPDLMLKAIFSCLKYTPNSQSFTEKHKNLVEKLEALEIRANQAMNSENNEAFSKELSGFCNVLSDRTKDIGASYDELREGLKLVARSVTTGMTALVQTDGDRIAEMIMISKEKYANLTRQISVHKKDLDMAQSELRSARKGHKNTENQLINMRNKLAEEEEKNTQLRSMLDSLASNEITSQSHMEALRAVQQTNQELNITIKKLNERAINSEAERAEISSKMADMENIHLSALRQERLRCDALRDDLAVSEGKIKDLNISLKKEIERREAIANEAKIREEAALAAQYEKRILEFSKKVEELETDTLAIEHQMKIERGSFDQILKDKQEELEKLKETVSDLRKANDRSNMTIKLVREEMRTLSDRVIELEAELAREIQETAPNVKSISQLDTPLDLSMEQLSPGRSQMITISFKEIVATMHGKLKAVYKSLVILMTQTEITPNNLVAVEKQLNDAIEALLIYV